MLGYAAHGALHFSGFQQFQEFLCCYLSCLKLVLHHILHASVMVHTMSDYRPYL